MDFADLAQQTCMNKEAINVETRTAQKTENCTIRILIFFKQNVPQEPGVFRYK